MHGDIDPIFDRKFWKDRLLQALDRGHPHLSIFRCIGDGWDARVNNHMRILAELLKSTDSILDVGCGYGRLLGLLPTWWHGTYIGVDFSPELLEFARGLHPNRKFLELDLRMYHKVRELGSLSAGKRFDWGIGISMKGMVVRNAGQSMWDGMESNLKMVCKRLLLLEFDTDAPEEVIDCV